MNFNKKKVSRGASAIAAACVVSLLCLFTARAMESRNPSLVEILVNPTDHAGKQIYLRGSVVELESDGFVILVEGTRVRIISADKYPYDEEVMVAGKATMSGAVLAEKTDPVEHYQYKSLAHYLLIIVVALLLIRDLRHSCRIERWQMY